MGTIWTQHLAVGRRATLAEAWVLVAVWDSEEVRVVVCTIQVVLRRRRRSRIPKSSVVQAVGWDSAAIRATLLRM